MTAIFTLKDLLNGESYPEIIVERDEDDDNESYCVASDILRALFNSCDFDVIAVGDWESWGNWEVSRDIRIEYNGRDYEVRLTSVDISFMSMYGYVPLNVYVPLS